MSSPGSTEHNSIPDSAATDDRFTFPRWANYLLPASVLLAIGVLTYLPVLWSFSFSPYTTEVGYQPEQPQPFSHALHAGQLQIDCRYCHSTVDRAAFAAIPPTQTCMNCHGSVAADSPLLESVRQSFQEGTGLTWIKVHDLPDFVYFDHSAHINAGVGCTSCHGRVDEMEVLYQSEPISMSWCLTCHRQPEQHLRPREFVTVMDWDPEKILGKSQEELGRELLQQYHIRPLEFMTSCTICHR